MPDVVVIDQAFGGVAQEQAVAERHGCTFAAHQARTEADAVAAAADAHVLFVNLAPITGAVLEQLAADAVVIRYGVGYDNVDVAAARALGIRVCNVPDYGADTVADHTVAMLLASLRRLSAYTHRIRTDGWAEPGTLGPIRGFDHTTVGLIGTGRIGRAVAARLTPFGFDVIASDPQVLDDDLVALGIRPVGLDQLLREADAVTLHAPLLPTTRHLLDAAAFARMRAGMVVVNTSRGALIDAEALVDALRSGVVAAAALDVFEDEPLVRTSPLRDLPDVILTPHAAFYSDTSLERLQRLAAEEADRVLTRRPLRCLVS